MIDLLIKAGHDESEAAQMVTRRLMAVGVPPPEKGRDARGWRRLLEWRTDLSHGLVSKEAPASERVKRVLDEQLWDRRRNAG